MLLQKLSCAILLLLALAIPGKAQTDTANTTTVADTGHSVKKATLRSLMIPGWGQIYNNKWWKVPIIYAGLGTTAYLAVDNHNTFKTFIRAFESRLDDDPSNDQLVFFNERQLIELQDIYRRWRDLSIIVGGLIYALNIIDAHVDAHLFDFDLNDDLTARWQPSVMRSTFAPPSVGLGLTLHFR